MDTAKKITDKIQLPTNWCLRPGFLLWSRSFVSSFDGVGKCQIRFRYELLSSCQKFVNFLQSPPFSRSRRLLRNSANHAACLVEVGGAVTAVARSPADHVVQAVLVGMAAELWELRAAARVDAASRVKKLWMDGATMSCNEMDLLRLDMEPKQHFSFVESRPTFAKYSVIHGRRACRQNSSIFRRGDCSCPGTFDFGLSKPRALAATRPNSNFNLYWASSSVTCSGPVPSIGVQLHRHVFSRQFCGFPPDNFTWHLFYCKLTLSCV